jgi:hypothetical protein
MDFGNQYLAGLSSASPECASKGQKCPQFGQGFLLSAIKMCHSTATEY